MRFSFSREFETHPHLVALSICVSIIMFVLATIFVVLCVNIGADIKANKMAIARLRNELAGKKNKDP